MNYVKMSIILIMFVFLSGCGDKETTFKEQIFKEYVDNNRVSKYQELKTSYGDIQVILWFNSKEDSWWITNFTLWCVFSILPDLPDVFAGAGVLGFIHFIAWWIGVVLTGGGILAVLAYIGALLGGVPGIPPALMGIIYLGVMFSLLTKIFNLIW